MDGILRQLATITELQTELFRLLLEEIEEPWEDGRRGTIHARLLRLEDLQKRFRRDLEAALRTEAALERALDEEPLEDME